MIAHKLGLLAVSEVELALRLLAIQHVSLPSADRIRDRLGILGIR